MNAWESFFIAQVGASAALAGLLFVGISINLNRILAFPRLPNRAFVALLLLIAVLVVSSFVLIPGQSPQLLGVEILLAGLAVWIVLIVFDIRIWQSTEAQYRTNSILLIIVNQIATLSYIFAGIILLMGNLAGLYWLVPAVLVSFVKALLDAWVLLVEINR